MKYANFALLALIGCSSGGYRGGPSVASSDAGTVNTPKPPPDVPPPTPREKETQYEAMATQPLVGALTAEPNNQYLSTAAYDFNIGRAVPGFRWAAA